MSRQKSVPAGRQAVFFFSFMSLGVTMSEQVRPSFQALTLARLTCLLHHFLISLIALYRQQDSTDILTTYNHNVHLFVCYSRAHLGSTKSSKVLRILCRNAWNILYPLFSTTLLLAKLWIKNVKKTVWWNWPWFPPPFWALLGILKWQRKSNPNWALMLFIYVMI